MKYVGGKYKKSAKQGKSSGGMSSMELQKGFRVKKMPSYKASPAESTEGMRSTAQIPDFVKRFNR